MRINILSQDSNLIDFCRYLKFTDHEVTFIEDDFPSCDLVIYAEKFQKEMDNISGCAKICFFPSEYTDNNQNFSISFSDIEGCYKINPGCTLSGPGLFKKELISDIAVCDEPTSNMEFLRKYMGFDYGVKVFNTPQPLPIYNYCGNIYGEQINNLYRSANVSVSLSEKTKYRIIESGGTVLTKDTDLNLPEEHTYTSEEDFHEKIEVLMKNEIQINKLLRDHIIKNHNPLVEWSNVFKGVGLKKISKQMLDIRNHAIKGLLI